MLACSPLWNGKTAGMEEKEKAVPYPVAETISHGF